MATTLLLESPAAPRNKSTPVSSPAPAVGATKPRRYETLDMWRGLCCLMLVVFHTTMQVARHYFVDQAGRVTDASSLGMWLAARAWIGVPIFFVIMGVRTNLRSFAEPGVLGLAAALTAAAILGKQLCALGAIGKGLDRLSIGIGMIPRGEVGLIFANMGLTLMVAGERIVDQNVFSAVVVMVIVTTLVTPPALKWSLERRARR